MNIKKSLEMISKIPEWHFTGIQREHLHNIFVALNEPKEENNPNYSILFKENQKFREDLCIANSLIKNLEEQLERNYSIIGRHLNRSSTSNNKKITPFNHLTCKFCDGTGIEKPLSEIKIYGKTIKQIAQLCDFAEEHGYKCDS